MVVRAWYSLLENPFSEVPEAGFGMLSNGLIDAMDVEDATNLQEFIDGAGGSLDHLAHLIVDFIDLVFPSRTTPLSKQKIFYLETVLDFVITADHIRDLDPNNSSLPLCAALRSQGFMRVLTTAFCVLSADNARP